MVLLAVLACCSASAGWTTPRGDLRASHRSYYKAPYCCRNDHRTSATQMKPAVWQRGPTPPAAGCAIPAVRREGGGKGGKGGKGGRRPRQGFRGTRQGQGRRRRKGGRRRGRAAAAAAAADAGAGAAAARGATTGRRASTTTPSWATPWGAPRRRATAGRRGFFPPRSPSTSTTVTFDDVGGDPAEIALDDGDSSSVREDDEKAPA